MEKTNVSKPHGNRPSWKNVFCIGCGEWRLSLGNCEILLYLWRMIYSNVFDVTFFRRNTSDCRFQLSTQDGPYRCKRIIHQINISCAVYLKFCSLLLLTIRCQCETFCISSSKPRIDSNRVKCWNGIWMSVNVHSFCTFILVSLVWHKIENRRTQRTLL